MTPGSIHRPEETLVLESPDAAGSVASTRNTKRGEASTATMARATPCSNR